MDAPFAKRLRLEFVSVRIQFDSSAFRAEFKKRVQRSKRSLAEVTNEVAFQILRAAMRRTPKADRSKIESLGISYQTMNKAGTRALKRARAVISPTTRFKLIYLKSLWRAGTSPRLLFANAAALDGVMKKKLARRSSSVGFVASGWVPAMRGLLRKIHGQSLSGADAKSFPATQGHAIPASDASWNPEAIIENATGMNAPGQSSASQARVENELTEAWQRGVNDVTAEMSAYEKKIERAFHGES